MAYSLLAHLFPYIKGSQEDVATYSLQYLLSQSSKLNAAFSRYVADIMGIEVEESLQYLCQVVGDSEDKERPDMVGIDAEGIEVVLFEMKFYASLTTNQPNVYLKRLQDGGGKGLLFICPSSRKTSLWGKIKGLCDVDPTTVNKFCVDVNGVKLAITIWAEVLGLLKQVASTADTTFVPDVIQLEGYCNRMDSDAFIPFSAVDLSAKTAKMAERYYSVVDEIINLLEVDEGLKTSRKGIKATGYRKGYTRSLYIDEFTITLNYDRDLWKSPSSVETPFWVSIRDRDWIQTTDIKAFLKTVPERNKEDFWGMTFVSLEPLQDATFSEVCDNLVKQILYLITQIRSAVH